MRRARVLTIALVLGSAIGAWMADAALEHNPQGEFSANGHLNAGRLLLVFGSWFVPIFVLTLALGFVWSFLSQRLDDSYQ